jgi:hypothetical protein
LELHSNCVNELFSVKVIASCDPAIQRKEHNKILKIDAQKKMQ